MSDTLQTHAVSTQNNLPNFRVCIGLFWVNNITSKLVWLFQTTITVLLKIKEKQIKWLICYTVKFVYLIGYIPISFCPFFLNAEVAQGVPGRLRPRTFLTFRHYKVDRSSAKHTGRLHPRRNPSYSLSEAVSTSGHMVLSGVPQKISPVTPPGIDPGTVCLVAQRLNHYATPGPFILFITYSNWSTVTEILSPLTRIWLLRLIEGAPLQTKLNVATKWCLTQFSWHRTLEFLPWISAFVME
jgi:hypothetical protein